MQETSDIEIIKIIKNLCEDRLVEIDLKDYIKENVSLEYNYATHKAAENIINVNGGYTDRAIIAFNLFFAEREIIRNGKNNP